MIPYALNHVLSIVPAVLNQRGYEDIRFDEAGNSVRARDTDTVITLTVWEQSPQSCSVEITSRLAPGSTLGQGPNLRRAERLGEDLAEAAAAMFQENGQPGGGNSTVPQFPFEPERQVQGEKVFIPGVSDFTDSADTPAAAGTFDAFRDSGSEAAAHAADGATERPRQEARTSTEASVNQAAEEAAAPPGWYPDPWDPAMARWYDGVQWTGYTQQP
jgi:hypothetical protein